jgi:hypothetical protein
MTIMYKLVTQNFTTMNNTVWEIGVTNKATGSGNKMCTDGVLHCYKTPEQAALFNPIHANIKNPILMKIECSTILDTDGLKYCSKEQTPLEILELPKFTLEQRIAFGIKCALFVCKDPSFIKWATAWLDGTDRTKESAYAAAHDAAYTDATAACGAADYAADYAANAAADAAAAGYAAAAADKFRSKDEFAMELDKIIASL